MRKSFLADADPRRQRSALMARCKRNARYPPGWKPLPRGVKVPKTAANGMIIRGMTFYKSEPDPMVADDGEPGENCESAL